MIMMKLKQKLNHHIIGQSKAIEQIINQLKLTKTVKTTKVASNVICWK